MTTVNVSAVNAEAAYTPQQRAVVSAVCAEVAYRTPPERGLALREVMIERVLRETVYDGHDRGLALREVAIERVLREYPELRGWGVYSEDSGEFVPFSSLNFYVTSYSGADLAEYELGENGRTRRGEVANGEFYAPRQITLTGRIIGENYSDTLVKTEALLSLLRPSSRAARLGESEKLKLAFFGSERFVVFDVKLSGNFAMPIESRAPCLRDVTLIFTSQDWPFGYDYDSALTEIDARAVFAADSACVLSYPRTEGGEFWRGPSAYPANSAIGALAVSEDWVLIAGNFTSLYGQSALGYAAVYNRNDGTWSGLLRTGFDADAVRSITAAAVRTDEYVFVGAQNGVRYFAFNPLTLQVLHSADPGAAVLAIAVRDRYGTPVLVLADGRIRERNINAATWDERGAITGARYVAVCGETYYVATNTTVYMSTDYGQNYSSVAVVSGGVINGLVSLGDTVAVYGTFTSVNGDTALGGVFILDGDDAQPTGWPGGSPFNAAVRDNVLYVAGSLYPVGDTAPYGRWAVLSYDGTSWTYGQMVIADEQAGNLRIAVDEASVYVANTHTNAVGIGRSVTVNNAGEYTTCEIEIAAQYDTWPLAIFNASTGERIIFEKRMMVGGERVTIDTRNMTVSTTVARRAPRLARGTTTTFGLRSGENIITIFALGYSSLKLSYNEAVDGVGAAETE